MNRKFFLVLGCIICSAPSYADWVASINVNVLNGDDEVGNFDTIGPSVTVGYRFDVAENIKLVPELRAGYGAPFDESSYYGAALRGEYMFFDNKYLIGIVSHQKVDVDVAFTRNDLDDNESGLGLGIGWQVNPRSAIETYYERIGDFDSYSLGYRLNF